MFSQADVLLPQRRDRYTRQETGNKDRKSCGLFVTSALSAKLIQMIDVGIRKSLSGNKICDVFYSSFRTMRQTDFCQRCRGRDTALLWKEYIISDTCHAFLGKGLSIVTSCCYIVTSGKRNIAKFVRQPNTRQNARYQYRVVDEGLGNHVAATNVLGGTIASRKRL